MPRPALLAFKVIAVEVAATVVELTAAHFWGVEASKPVEAGGSPCLS